MKHRIGVLLCGCGACDGTDPYEAVFTFLEIQRAGHEAVALALDEPQFHVADHATSLEAEGDTRNQFTESARVTRSKIYTLDEISPKLLDAVIIPGGQGVPKNLTRVFEEDHRMVVREPLACFLKAVQGNGGPIGAVSLAEFIITELFGPFPEGRGCFDLAGDEVLENRELALFLTPGQTVSRDLSELHRGVRTLVEAVIARIGEGPQVSNGTLTPSEHTSG